MMSKEQERVYFDIVLNYYGDMLNNFVAYSLFMQRAMLQTDKLDPFEELQFFSIASNLPHTLQKAFACSIIWRDQQNQIVKFQEECDEIIGGIRETVAKLQEHTKKFSVNLEMIEEGLPDQIILWCQHILDI